ncbi:cupin domain-containing protein [Segnochrobactrum spirostomi]|uniref:cupin domain-containing protein n=1 Tax=Segnochrobactrum spirostomi TaxID=2608987 RepID=UPI001AD831F5|nr:cupin domain-containing protein [Segnochrobactrum spirostomi]
MKKTTLLAFIVLAAAPRAGVAGDDVINGEPVPFKPAPAESTLLMRHVEGGTEYVVFRSARGPGLRSPIHRHTSPAYSCVVEGEATVYMEGSAPHRYVAGECFWMPSGVRMANVNTGSKRVVLYDNFSLPVGTPYWQIDEDMAKHLDHQWDAPKTAPKTTP